MSELMFRAAALVVLSTVAWGQQAVEDVVRPVPHAPEHVANHADASTDPPIRLQPCAARDAIGHAHPGRSTSSTASQGLPDADGDGVPDVDDLCFGDDRLDADGDGIPDACDPCTSPVPDTDCDRNGLDDACDLRVPARLLTFSPGASDPSAITLAPNGTAEIVDNRLQLIRDTTTSVSGAMIEPLGPTRVDSFAVSFWFRATGDPTSFEGFTFGLYPAQLGPDHQLGSNSSGAQMHVDFGGVVSAGPNQITLRHTSAVADTYSTPFPLNDGVWRRVDLERLDGLTSMTLTEPGSPPLRVFEDQPLPTYTAYPMRFGFGAGTLNPGVETTVWIDDVWIRDLSGLFDRDLDGDGVLDACQAPASQVSRVGTPPNPDVFAAPGDAPGPIMGEVYAPFVDHDDFASDAVLDQLIVGFAPDNVPFAAGTLLVASPAAPDFVAVPAGKAFALMVPTDAQLLSAPIVMQVVSLGPDGPELTNAIDAVVGAWVPTK